MPLDELAVAIFYRADGRGANTGEEAESEVIVLSKEKEVADGESLTAYIS